MIKVCVYGGKDGGGGGQSINPELLSGYILV